MSFHLLVGDRALLSGASARVPADQRRAFGDAHALLAGVMDEAAASAARAAKAEADGWQAGWQAAAARAEAALAQQAADAAAAVAVEAEARRATIAQAALAGAEAIVGAIDPEHADVRIALAAIGRVPEDERVVIACAPALADRIRDALDGRDNVSVEPRDGFAPGRVELMTGAGRLVADLSVQLDALADRWGVSR